MTTSPIAVLVADDHALIRKGVVHVINRQPDMQVVAEADDGHAVLAQLRKYQVDVLLLDITMPGPDVFDLIRDILAAVPRLHILILSMHPEAEYGPRLIQAGAKGYIHKAMGLECLIAAIREICSGRTYIRSAPPETRADPAAGPPPHASLSNREYQVLRMIATGESHAHIARTLSISVKTVSTYRARILEKLGVENNTELTRYALKHHLF